jgi:osmotically-inducible protein OsmY
MPLDVASQCRDAELQQAIERQIVQRTWGRIHRLQVDVCDGHVVVHGCTQSYYQKQLALQGVLDVLGSTDPRQVEMDIVVGDNSPRAPSTLVAAVRSLRPSR